MYACVSVCVCMCPWKPEDIPGTQVIRGCELPNVDAGSQTWGKKKLGVLVMHL